MNKKTLLSPFRRPGSSLAPMLLLLALAACTGDELTDGMVQDLPDGRYPLTFTATQTGDEVQTRVSDYDDTADGKHKSKWDGGEVIGVQIGNGTAGTYTLKADGSINEQAANTPTYWQSTAKGQTITAWYPATAASDYLKKQSGALPYVLKATTTADFNTAPQLQFKHQLAKFRFKLSGTAITQGVNPNVSVKGIANTTYTNGEIQAASGAATEDITPHTNGEYYEVLLLPGQVADDFIAITVPGITGTYHYTPKSADAPTANLTLNTASCYTYDITVNKPEPTPITGGEISKPGDYIMTGNITQTVTLNSDGIILTLDGVTSNIATPIKIEQGTPTIILKGNNSLTASGAPAIWLIGKNTNVVIKGTENSHLKVSSTDGSAAIGTCFYNGYGTNPCGDIRIEEASIEASSVNGAAAIGTGGGFYGAGTCGVITIIKSDITATVKEYHGKPAVIGTGGTDGQPMSCKGINITLKVGQTKSDFENSLTGPYTTKVGAGEGLNSASNTCSYVNWYNADGTPAN